MIVFYILDEGLPVEMNTGWSIPEGRKAYDKVGNMQSAIKFLVKNKDTAACKVQDIEIYPLGVTKAMYDKGGPSLPKPLKPTDKLPEGSSKQNAIFVHVPRAKQQLSPDLRSFYVQPVPVKKMARPEIDMLIISPKRKKKTMPRKMIEMTVKCTHNDKEFKKMIDPKNTISQLKEKFAEPSGVPASNQNLFVNGNELADDDEMAKDAGIKHRSTIYLEPKTIQVTVRTPDSKHIPVTMKQTDTIQFLKEQVAPESGVEVADQNLKYHGNLLSNDKTARESGLEDGAIIDLMPNTINVTVRAPDGKNIPVTMKPTDTTEFIKEKVAPISGIEVPKQILKFQGNVMPDKKTAGAMGLKDGSVLDLSTPVEKEKKKKMEKEDKDDDFPGVERKNYNIPFTPTPFDLTRFKAWFIVGDQVPFEMICPIEWTIADFKVEILRNDAKFVERYLRDVENPSQLKVYPAGSWGIGEPLADDLPIPKDSSQYAFFSVLV